MTPISLGGNSYCSSCGTILKTSNQSEPATSLPFDPTAQPVPQSNNSISNLRFRNENKLTEDQLEVTPINTTNEDSISLDLENSTIADIQESKIQKHTFNQPNHEINFPIKSQIIEGLPGSVYNPALDNLKIAEITNTDKLVPTEKIEEAQEQNSDNNIKANEIADGKNNVETSSIVANDIEVGKNNVGEIAEKGEFASTNIADKPTEEKVSIPDANTADKAEKESAQEEPDEFKILLANLTAEISKANSESKTVEEATKIETDTKSPNGLVNYTGPDLQEKVNSKFDDTDNNPAISGYKLNEPTKKIETETDNNKNDITKIPQPDGILLDILDSDNVKPVEEDVAKTVDKVLDGINFNTTQEAQSPAITPVKSPGDSKDSSIPKKVIAINDIVNPITHPELNSGNLAQDEPAPTSLIAENPPINKKVNDGGEITVQPPKDLPQNGSPKELLESIQKRNEIDSKNNFPVEQGTPMISEDQSEKILDLDTKEMKKSKFIDSQQKSGAMKDYFSSIINDRPSSQSPKFRSEEEDYETKSLKKLKTASVILFGTSILLIAISLVIIGVQKNKIQIKSNLIEARANANAGENSAPLLLTDPGDWRE